MTAPNLHATILIADDDATIRRNLRLLLEAESYRAVEAADGLEAADALADPAVSLVLLDLRMPGRDGMDLLRGALRDDPSLANSDPLLSPTSIRSLAFDPNDSSNTYYAGSTGRIWRTTDRGASWTDLSAGLPNNVVTHIAVSPLDSNRLYATLSGFGNGHVFRSFDGGLNWTSVAGNLPDVPTISLLIEPATDGTILYVGTDIGIFRSLDDGDHWDRYSNGLPTVRVEDLLLSPATGALIASTHGRGIWQLNR